MSVALGLDSDTQRVVCVCACVRACVRACVCVYYPIPVVSEVERAGLESTALLRVLCGIAQ